MDDFAQLEALLSQMRGEFEAQRSPSRPPPTPVTARSITAFASQFTRSIRSIDVRIPGSHYSGLSNQQLLAVRVREGRDFDAWTAQLRQKLSQHLQQLWRARGSIPSIDEATQDAQAFLHDAIVERVEQGGDDVMLQPLTRAYAQHKAKAGKGARPIGVLTGRWLAALRDRGSVRVDRKSTRLNSSH